MERSRFSIDRRISIQAVRWLHPFKASLRQKLPLLMAVLAISWHGDLAAQSPLSVGEVHRFESVNYPGRFIRHANFVSTLTEMVTGLDFQDSRFRVVRGLGAPNGVSFESMNYPGYYLRHSNFLLRLDPLENSELYRQDATFYVRAGLAPKGVWIESAEYPNVIGVSFESVNYPGYYLRHSNFQLRLDPAENSDLYRQDATFCPLMYGPVSCFCKSSKEVSRLC